MNWIDSWGYQWIKYFSISLLFVISTAPKDGRQLTYDYSQLQSIYVSIVTPSDKGIKQKTFRYLQATFQG